MSIPTPKTDEQECEFSLSANPDYDGPHLWVESSFSRKLERENIQLVDLLSEAKIIIDVLHMDALDNNKESWPRASEWMKKIEELQLTEK